MDDSIGFSGVIRISNASDYIAPSAACVIPVRTSTVSDEGDLVGRHAKKEGQKPVKVSISLADCLACAGCVTSAETVLIEEQNLQAALRGLRDSAISVVSVSPASLASIAAHRKCSLKEAAQRITLYFISNGASLVIDANLGQTIALEEFWNEVDEMRKRTGKALPLLVSACPGFVCYAEKSHGDLLLPLMSRVKSSQGVLGVLVKEFLPRFLNFNGEQGGAKSVFHVSVQPCFDRKLEASRPENSTGDNQHVDCVLGTAELNDALDSLSEEEMEESRGREEERERRMGRVPRELTGFMRGELFGIAGNVSGGYVDYCIERWSGTVAGEVRVETTKPSSNLEVCRASSASAEKKPFVAARLYGFRNIQNLVRKLKTKKEVEYDVIEVMACPAGCASGGGQVRSATNTERMKVNEEIEQLYRSIAVGTVSDTVRAFQGETKRDRLLMQLRDVKAESRTSLAW